MYRFRLLAALLLTALAAGAETEIHVKGVRNHSEKEVLGLMGARLVHVRNSPASASRADDAAVLLRQILLSDGFAKVDVDWKIVNSREILLIANTGTRLSLGTVTVTGAPAGEDENLAKLYERPAKKDRPIGAGDPPFREEDIEDGLNNIAQELKSKGYWGVDVKLTDRETEPDTGKVNLKIDVDPGSVHRIGTPHIISPDSRGLVRTKTTAQPFVGKDATTANLNEMRNAVEQAFLSRGYPDAKITMGRTLSTSYFIPDFYIDLGTRVRLDNVRTEGLQKTNPARVRQRVVALEGDWYDEAAMNKRVRGLLATGAFTSVRVEKVPTSEKHIDVLLHFEEGKAKQVSLALGADTYLGPIARATYADRNLWGQLLGFSTGAEVSARGVLGETKITDPWFLGRELSASARAYALIFGSEGYTSSETGLEVTLERQFGEHYTLNVLAGYSLVNISGKGVPTPLLGETLYTNPRLRVTQSLDFRNSKVLPTKGFHVEFPVEIGAAVGADSTTYVSAGLTGGYYHKINEKYQIGLGGEAGLLIPSGGGEFLPIDLRLFNGGARSVRSFPERELGPQANGYPTGGEAMWNANFELIRAITGSVKAVGFFDAGSLSRSYGDIGSADLELAVGLGIRLELPIGPVRFEYGYNLTQDPGEPSGAFHFAIGTAF